MKKNIKKIPFVILYKRLTRNTFWKYHFQNTSRLRIERAYIISIICES